MVNMVVWCFAGILGYELTMKLYVKYVFFVLMFLNIHASAGTTYLIRHAEKDLDGSKDPSLTIQGHQRAQNIAHLLSKAKITRIFSSNYKRTLQTAAPLAKITGVQVELYDPRKLKEFAAQLKEFDTNVLVVGHSNTTPYLTELLSGEKVEPIDDSEYDNIYQLVFDGGYTVLHRFQSSNGSALK